jgi:hypothetical protein
VKVGKDRGLNEKGIRVTDPLDRITLSLRPKDGGQAKAGSSASMRAMPQGIDRAVLEELLQATRTFDYLRAFGQPIEFWEAVRLARARRGVAEGKVADSDGPDAGLLEELQVIRRQLSPMVRDLRAFLKRVPDLPPPGEALEVALGFLLASSKEHKAVAKWLSESDEHLDKAASKLRSLYTIAAPYLDVLRPWSLDGKPPAPVAAAPGKSAAPEQAPAAVIPIDPDVLDNLRRAIWCRKQFAEAQLDAAFWEVLMLNVAERVPTQARQMRIVQARKDNQLAVYHEETRNLHARLLPLRARHGRWVDVLRSWLRSLPGVPQNEGEFELAVAFEVVEPDGQERARKWLGAPEAHAREAAAHVNALAARAKAYVVAVRKNPV